MNAFRGLVLTLILLACPASLAADSQASFTAASAAWTSPASFLDGEGIGLQAYVDVNAQAASSAGAFRIQAPSMRVEWDLSHNYVDAGGTSYPGDPEQGNRSFSSALLEATASRTSELLYVFPTPSKVRLETSCSSVTPSQLETLSVVSKINTRPDVARSTLPALQVEPCGGSSLSITGSFVVVLWEWDARVTSGSETQEFWSGKAPPTTVPGATDQQRYVTEAQQLYVTVNDGTFTMNEVPGRRVELYLDTMSIEGLSGLFLVDATGQVRDQAAMSAHRLTLGGSLQAELRPRLEAVQVVVQDGLTHVVADGREEYEAGILATTVASEASSPWWIFLLLALLAAAAALTRTPSVTSYCYALAVKAYERKRPRTRFAAFWAWWATQQRRHGDPHLLRAHLLMIRGNPEAALKAHLQAHRLYQEAGELDKAAANALEAARTCHDLQQVQDMQDWLRLAHKTSAAETYRLLLRAPFAPLRTHSFDLAGYA